MPEQNGLSDLVFDVFTVLQALPASTLVVFFESVKL